MPFPFVYLCDLLNDLELPHVSRYPMLPKDLANYTKDKVIRWLRLHRDRLNAFSTDSEAVILMLQPEKQTERVFGLDAFNLEPVVARALCLPRQHYLDLQQWKTEPAKGDLGACVKRVMENMDIMATPGQANAVTVEDIDQSLLQIAAFDKRSSPAVQSLASSWKYPDGIELLGNIYRKLQAREAKWLTRLVLKSYAPIQFPENLEPGPQHSYLPNCVQLNIKFPSSAPAPIRRDGTRLIMGVGPKNPVIPTPPSTMIALPPSSPSPPPARKPALPLSTTSTPRPVSSAPTPAVPSAKHAFPTPSSTLPAPASSISATEPTSSTPISSIFTAQRTMSTPASSLPILNSTERHKLSSKPSYTPSPRPLTRASPHNQQSTSSRIALGPLSQNILSSGPQKSPGRSSPGLSIFTGGNGTCKRAPYTCPLNNYVFILGPCIPKDSYVNEELLGGHGCRYITSIRALSHPSLHTRCQTGKRLRKFALVEARDMEPTVDFLKRIRKLDLMRKGKKEWVEVYDWRLLEYISRIEHGKEYSYDIWARSWMCRV